MFLCCSPKKLLCMSRRGTYTSDTHQVSTAALRSEQMCNYDLDDLDQRWLNSLNGERALMGVATITELEMEKSIEEFEKQSWVKINQSMKQTEEEDQEDSVVCNVCRSVSYTQPVTKSEHSLTTAVNQKCCYNLQVQ